MSNSLLKLHILLRIFLSPKLTSQALKHNFLVFPQLSTLAFPVHA